MSFKIGFCCKWVSPNGDLKEEKRLNQVDVTLSRLLRLTESERDSLLYEKVSHNASALIAMVEKVSLLPEPMRMFRITSDFLPCYGHSVTENIYDRTHFEVLVQNTFSQVGEIAKREGIRLVFHPDHFVRLNSDDHSITTRAISVIEHHAELYRIMGMSSAWHSHGAAINIHLGGREGGIQSFRDTFNKLSDEAKRLLTIENDEFSFGLSDLMHIADLCPIVTDIYHEWVFTRGEYIQPDDKRITDVIIPSWRGVRPLGHFSQPKEGLWLHQSPDILPDFKSNITNAGISAIKARSHSYTCWNAEMNKWAESHLSWMDLEIEAKGKNLAAHDFYKNLISTQL